MAWQRKNCPLCLDRKGTPDTRLSFAINEDTGFWHCFRCEAKGKDDVPVSLPMDQGRPRMWDKELPWGTIPALDDYEAARYLWKRGLTRKEVKDNNLLYCPTGYFAGRVICVGVPSFWFQGRAIYPEFVPKYLGASWAKEGAVFPSGTFPTKRVVVCEGPFDAIRIARVCPAVALFGKRLDPEQAKTIKGLAEEAVVMLDKDAVYEAGHVFVALSRVMPTRQATLWNVKDPGEAALEQIREAVWDRA